MSHIDNIRKEQAGPRFINQLTVRTSSQLVQRYVTRIVAHVFAAGFILLLALQIFSAYSITNLYQQDLVLYLNQESQTFAGATNEDELKRLLRLMLRKQTISGMMLISDQHQYEIAENRDENQKKSFWLNFIPQSNFDSVSVSVELNPILSRGTTWQLAAHIDNGFLSSQISTVLGAQMILTLVWICAFALILSFRFLRRLTGPIVSLAQGLSQLDEKYPTKNIVQDLGDHAGDEIGQLIKSTNSLLVRLETNIRKEHAHAVTLTEHDKFLREIINHVTEGIVYLSLDHKIVRANPMAASLFECADEKFLEGKEFSSFLSLSSQSIFNAHLMRLSAETDTSHPLASAEFLAIVTKHDSTELSLSICASCVLNSSGKSYIIVFRDVGETRRAKELLRQNEMRLKLAVRATRSGVWDYDLKSNVFWWSPEFLAMLGYQIEEISASMDSKYALIHPDDLSWVKTSTERFINGESLEFNPEYRVKRKDGTWMWVEDKGACEKDSDGVVIRFSGAMSDCSERKRFEKQLMYMATHDPMTNLPNRTLLNDRLEHALIASHRSQLLVATLLLDIDRFKLINDSLGHEMGDQLIKSVAKRLEQSVRPSDTLCHMSADEFVIICEDIAAPQEAARIAKRLISSLNQPFLIDGNQLNVSVSIGISINSAEEKDSQTLLRHADTALHSAKAGGGGTYRFFATEMNKAAVRRLSVERNLHIALETQQFRLQYQPKVDIQTRRVVSAEALIRWPHQKWGPMPPDQFIPIAEETGLIVGIGEWVLREALSQICAWRELGLKPIPIAVNLSGKQLLAGGTDELILRMLREYDVPPRLLEVEVTESMLMSNVEKVMGILARLKESGVGVALDDFGTGYSSLAWLHKLPISALKIDRSFVREIPAKPESNAVASIILEMGRQLGLTVVAEGIETEEQWQFLNQHQCTLGQGWLFYKAMSSADFEKFLVASQSRSDTIY